MSKSRKYECRIIPDNNSWTVEIVRRVTSKKFHVSKSKDGFMTENEAVEWGKQEMKSFIQNLNEQNKLQEK